MCKDFSIDHYIGGSLERDKYMTVYTSRVSIRMLHDQCYKQLSSKRIARFIRLKFELLKKQIMFHEMNICIGIYCLKRLGITVGTL